MSHSVEKIPADYLARNRAIEIDSSFIVQAPAGSGKTGLLTQRFLKLLSITRVPEEIIAITFTRKAAGEMRDRIIDALVIAQTEAEPENDYEKKTYHLARSVLKQDLKMNWNLLQNTGRLRVQTIDSLCTELARQLPLLSEFGSVPAIIDDASVLYSAAAMETLTYLESTDKQYQWAADALAVLLKHQDNRMDKVQELIAAMLARRDQWLRHVADLKHPQLRRDQIEPVLKRIVEDALCHLKKIVPDSIMQQLPELLRFASLYAPKDSLIKSCHELQTLPEPSIDGLPKWLAIADILLTSDNHWRKPKGVNKKIGFPAVADGEDKEQKALFKQQKSKFQALLENIADNEVFNEKLAFIRFLPHYQYTDDEWDILDSLFKVLLFSSAQLRTVFSHFGQVDFIEMLLAAKRALGDSEQPSDLSLRLDYQIKHLLVDEFQDSSQNQFDLFTQLTQGWQPGDGRTLFLVGDPMQSIYRFREAEVGLFIQAWNNGIADVTLETLNLTVNFRSQKNIIHWVNTNFPVIFPGVDDKVSGAVSYTEFEAYKAEIHNSTVMLHPLFNRDDTQEAELIINLIAQAKKTIANGRIAVLCRNKSHLEKVISMLDTQLIPYQAVEINVLMKQPVIQDLLSLSKALLHLADRISWLALLRAPFIGLALNDLHLLTFENPFKTVWQCLTNEILISKLSNDGQLRLARALPLLESTLQNRQRKNLRIWIEGVWLALGGPACCANDTLLAETDVYFQLLETLESDKELLDSELLDRNCQKLFALPDVSANDKLQLMTIHKSKGLEFETVIMPGLGKSTASDKSKLLYWCEKTSQQGTPELVFGPIKPIWEQSNKTTDYLKYLEQQKIKYEVSRLIYVAVTRAKQNLHLIGHVNIKSDGSLATPANNSLLMQLWPVVEKQFVKQFDMNLASEELECDNSVTTDVENNVFYFENYTRLRLVSDWKCPTTPENIELDSSCVEIDTDELNLEFDWATDTALHIGSVVHRILEQISNLSGGISDSTTEIKNIIECSKTMLLRLGVVEQQLENASGRVLTAVNNTLADERGRWILSNKHSDTNSEFRITGKIDNEIRHMIIDRTFVDEDDLRWIIDYKTGSHLGSGLDDFLDREQQRYFPQLQAYAQVMQLMDNRKIKIALYFPMMQQWREWNY